MQYSTPSSSSSPVSPMMPPRLVLQCRCCAAQAVAACMRLTSDLLKRSMMSPRRGISAWLMRTPNLCIADSTTRWYVRYNATGMNGTHPHAWTV